MLQLNNISKSYGDQILLKEASVIINRGERCAFVGRNGAGKSTLMRLIAGEEEPDKGTIFVPRGYRLGMLNQHLSVSAETLIDEASKGLKEDRPDQRYKVETILFGLGFNKEDLKRPPQAFSGGYQIRIHLCKLLVSEPDCLLLDEPSNYLDIVTMRWLVRFLKAWRGELLVISHDREFLDSFSTHTVGLHRHGLKKVAGGTEAFYSQVFQEEEIYEKTRMKCEKKRAHMQSFVDRFGAKATKAAQAQSRVKAMSRLPVLEHLATMLDLDFSFRYEPYQSQKVLNCDQVSFTYPNGKIPIIQDFDFLLERGDKVAIIGKNGKGKSTLLQVMSRLLNAQQGTIKMTETVRIGYFGQTHIDRLDPRKTVYEEVAGANTKLSLPEVKAICGTMMFSGDAANKRIEMLSGGERSRVLLGKILATPCNLLLLDEPTNHLDMESVEAFVSAIEAFAGAVILVTHSEWILHRIPTKLIVCREGEQSVFLGSYEDFLRKGGWDEELPKPKAEAKNKPQVDAVAAKPTSSSRSKKELERIEKEITEGEITKEKILKALVELSEREERLAVARLSEELAACEAKLESLYGLYQKLSG